MEITRLSKILSYWLPPVVLILLVLIFAGELSSVQNTAFFLNKFLNYFYYFSSKQIMQINVGVRFGAHIFIYLVLYLLLFRLLRGYYQFGAGRASFEAFSWCLVIAVLDEGHQSLLKTRTGSIFDIMLDMSGVAVLAVTIIVWSKISRHKRRQSYVDVVTFLIETGDVYHSRGEHELAARFYKKALSLMDNVSIGNKNH